jgi:hypothetical protein
MGDSCSSEGKLGDSCSSEGKLGDSCSSEGKLGDSCSSEGKLGDSCSSEGEWVPKVIHVPRRGSGYQRVKFISWGGQRPRWPAGLAVLPP